MGIRSKNKGENKGLPFDFELFFQNASLPIQVLKGDRFVYANPATLKELGFNSVEEFPMENPVGISPEYQPDGQYSHIKAQRMLAMALEEGSARFDWVHVRKNGERFVSEVLLTPVESDGDRFIFSSWTDLTDRIDLEQKRRALEQRVETATKTQAIAELSGGLAHDLNNFLQVIAGYAQLGQQGASRESIGYLQRVIESTESARKLVRRMLAVGKSEQAARRNIELNTFLLELEPLLRMIVGHRITLRVEVPEELVLVLAEPVGLERAIMNLVSNASDATDDGGCVTVTLSRATVDDAFRESHVWAAHQDYVVVSVEDDGVGMDGKTASRVFEPFFSDKRKSDGTGLGLSNVMSTISGFGGGIVLSSEPGKGTRFDCYLLPAGAANDTEFDSLTAATSRAELDAAGCTCSAIVFDRNPEVRELTRLALEDASCQVVMPENEADIRAVFLARSEIVGVIVIDADDLFDLEGLVRWMRQRSRSPIVITSTHFSPALDGVTKAVPGCGLLLKPYDLDHLRTTITDLENELQPDNRSGL